MPGAELGLSGPHYEPLSGVQPGSVGEPAGTVPAPALNSPSVPVVDPASTHWDDNDSDSGFDPSVDDPDDDYVPPLPDSPSPSLSPSPSHSPSPAVSPEPEPDTSSPAPPSDTRDSRTPPAPGAPYTTRSGRSVRPAGEWWKVNHPYQHARELRRPQRSGRSPESAEVAIAALEDANLVRALSDSELIEYAFLTGTEPHTYKEAMTRDDAGLWHDASQQEYDALHQHGVWELCELPPGRKAVGCCWVYRIKTNADGTVERYKARLVAKGFSQKPHLNYTETFAPVAKFASLRTVLAIAAAEDMEVHSMDVSSAFLNGDLDEEIYMAQ